MLGQWGEIIEIVEETDHIQFVKVFLFQTELEIEAIHYVYEGYQCEVGNCVEVNTSAIDLKLGTGGYGFIMSIQDEYLLGESDRSTTNDKRRQDYPGHIMKLRYTPHQTPVLAAEAPESNYHSLFRTSFNLQQKLVLMGELHSMLPIMVSLLHRWRPHHKVAYIMDDQATLHLALSDHVRFLKEKVDLTTITFGQAVGGDLETVNLYTALEAAVKVVGADHIIITQGPGVVGTDTERGFSGMQLVHWLHTVHSCGGQSIVIPRIQYADHRTRHYGISHHTLQPLVNHLFVSTRIPYPISGQENDLSDQWLVKQLQLLDDRHKLVPLPIDCFRRDLEEALAWFGRPIKTMGRGYTEDPYYFYAVGAAFHLYKMLVVGENQ